MRNRMHTTRTLPIAALLLLASACATTGGGASAPSSRYKQADFGRLPKVPLRGSGTASEVTEEGEQAKLSDAVSHVTRGNEANTSGNADQAHAEWTSAADMLVSFVEQFPSSDWVIVVRYEAARYYLYAQQYERAAVTAERLVDDPNATPVTRALAAHLAAAAWQNLAISQVKAGKLEGIKLPSADQRKEPLAPRPPPGAWRQFVAAADRYVQYAASEPKERLIDRGPAQLSLLAAQIKYAFDDMEEARARFDKILHTWPGEDVMDQAVQLYLQTFLVTKDQAGYRQALEGVKALVAAEMEKATKAGDAKRTESLTKVQEQLARYGQRGEYDAAKDLLDQGKFVEAAQRFEAIAEANKGTDAAAAALNNAAYSWNKAEQYDKAVAAIQALLAAHPGSPYAPGATLTLANLRSHKDDHAAAAAAYEQYLEKWPDAEQRCIAIQNLGYELDRAGKPAAAADRYVAFATDPKCGKGDPNASAKALYRAGALYGDAKQKAKARDAFEKTTAVQGVTDPVAKSQVEEAKRMLKSK